MIVRNISNRNIILKDTSQSVFNVPAYSDLTVDDSKWTDTEFRRWVRYRIRDIVVVATTTSFPGNITQKGTLASRPAAGNPGLLYYITDAGQERWTRDNGSVFEEVPQLNTRGTVTFGTSADVDLYRQGVDILATDDDFQVRRAQVGMVTIGGTSSASISFGSSADSTLTRTGAAVLETNSQLHSLRPTVGSSSLGTKVTGDTQDRFNVQAGGIMQWGSGSGSADANLYRSATSTLKTDNNLVVAGTTTLQGAATAPTVATNDDSTNIATTSYVKSNLASGAVPVPASIAANETATYNGTTWVRSSVTKLGTASMQGYPWSNGDIATGAAIAISKLAGFPNNAGQVLFGDGTWGAIQGVPTGVVLPYGAAAAPTGWVLADGSAISRATFSALFALLGTTFGVGDGSTTFNIPDMRARVPVGRAASGGHTDVALIGNSDAVTLANRRPKHRHTVSDPGHVHGGTFYGPFGGAVNTIGSGASGVGFNSVASGVTNISVGSSVNDAIDAMPYMVLSYIIKT